MNVVKLVILLGSVACGLGLEAWEADAVEALALDTEEVQVMGTVHMGDLHVAAAYPLVVAVATAGHLHIAMLHMILLMLTGIGAGVGAEDCPTIKN